MKTTKDIFVDTSPEEEYGEYKTENTPVPDETKGTRYVWIADRRVRTHLIW